MGQVKVGRVKRVAKEDKSGKCRIMRNVASPEVTAMFWLNNPGILVR
jgi:hypothetical protein